MAITITTAPCCWGVDDVTNPNLPYGYVPLDLPLVSDALQARGLFIVAGTI